jgi:hypothetical protein
MKIGLQVLAYNCDKSIKKLLQPWIYHKVNYDIKIWVASGQFKIYHDMGCENENSGTLKILKSDLYHEIDYLFEPTPGFLLSDHETRSSCLNYFREENIDLMIMLDSDEFYTEKDVENLLSYVKDNQNFDWYTVNFKNIIGDGSKYVEYKPLRVIWFKKKGYVKKYYFDNHIVFDVSGKDYEYRQLKGHDIPKEILNPPHYTWTNNLNTTGPSDIRKKMAYQEKYYSHECGWSWDEETQNVVPNKNFWGDNVPETKELS